jgi:hypothetical protein
VSSWVSVLKNGNAGLSKDRICHKIKKGSGLLLVDKRDKKCSCSKTYW